MSESDVCRRQIPTHREGPRTERIKIVIMAVDHNIGIQMNWKELSKTSIMY